MLNYKTVLLIFYVLILGYNMISKVKHGIWIINEKELCYVTCPHNKLLNFCVKNTIEWEGCKRVRLHNRCVKADNDNSTLSSQCFDACQFNS